MAGPNAFMEYLPSILLLFAALACKGLAIDEIDESVAARRPKYERVNGNIETLWQRPHQGLPISGVVFLAHGCQHQATDFFSERGHDGWELQQCRRSNFKKCLGLPEERALVDAARTRGYMALAVSGGTGFKSCWNMQADPERVKNAITHVLAAESLPIETPVIAIGASSGGAFLGFLANSNVLYPQLKCIAPQISRIQLPETGADGVRTIFVHMPRDVRTAHRVGNVLEELHARGIDATELLVKPLPVTVELLARGMSHQVAERVVNNLRDAGLMDPDGLLTADPRSSFWRKTVRHVVPQEDTLVADESSLAELLNVAWASHEITSQHAKQIFDFCAKRFATNDEL